ncbi:hypothetical protein L2E82_20868 [Cichorium intybus]|uniref:Uncharacterized protein n=1 Tax=Cichorium intybus TaxID=13427 RepID=A0ACB9DUZ6_CICIN|nr:hypothetical protein L2E82_20868 [Cichorium intybus]
MHISGVSFGVSFDRHTPKHGNLVVCPSLLPGILSVILFGLRYLVFWSSCPSARRGGFRLFFLSFLSVCNFRL